MSDILGFSLIFAQEAAPPAASPLQFLFPLLLIGVAFYFLILRPQGRERKEREKQLATLGKGDRVVTIGGLHGLVTKMGKTGKTIELELAKNVRIVLNKSAVASITKKGKGEAAAAQDEEELE